MKLSKNGKALDLRLGWLEAFLDVAHYLDYGRAGQELGISARQVQRIIEQLELWTRRELFSVESPLELDSLNGSEFILIAIDVLALFDDCCAKEGHSAGGVDQDKRRNLRISQFQAFLDVARNKKFEAVKQEQGGSVTNLKRDIQCIENVLGVKLLSGRGVFRLTPQGEKFVIVASQIVERLERFRPTIEESAQSYAKIIRKYQIVLSGNIGVWERRGRLSAKTRRDLEDTKLRLQELNEIQMGLEKVFGPLPSTSASHIDMDAFFRDRDKDAADVSCCESFAAE